MIKAIYFDLFFTLIIPTYETENSEYSILNLSIDEWEKYAENEMLYRERALGLVKTEVDKIISIDEYWSDDGDAPPWRQEMHIGRPIK